MAAKLRVFEHTYIRVRHAAQQVLDEPHEGVAADSADERGARAERIIGHGRRLLAETQHLPVRPVDALPGPLREAEQGHCFGQEVMARRRRVGEDVLWGHTDHQSPGTLDREPVGAVLEVDGDTRREIPVDQRVDDDLANSVRANVPKLV